MTPRETLLQALRRETPSGLPPHLELEYQLTEITPGIEQVALRAPMLEGVTGAARQEALKRNAEMWVKVAQRFDWSCIMGLHWLDLEDQCASFGYVREIAGDTYMLGTSADGTFGIPDGAHMMDQVIWFTEHPEEALEAAQGYVDIDHARIRALVEAGAEVIFMCADYCFNDGPFLSPTMFGKFVTPFLTQQADNIRALGAYSVKHTDGNIMPILDQLVASGVDGLHSLDPMAGVDIAEVRRLYGDRIALVGNVNCAWVQAGTKQQIEQSARYCLEHGGVGQPGYVYATSNCIFAGVPLENYEWMLQLRQEYADRIA
ncbi:MAG TPA: uroporphyrinogen decarboxylase family protein [Armatimonadota bacterium]|jgi:uroporphyrinogen decarboxylase